MMPEHMVHVPTIPPSRVGVAVPEARNYVHPTPSGQADEPQARGFHGLSIALGMALMLVLAMAVIGLLVATNHVVFR